MISKKDQLKKNRQFNPKKLPQIELQLFKDFIFDKANGKCQEPNCTNSISEYHHAEYGAYKSDMSLTGICRQHHTIIHFSTDTKRREALNIIFKSLGKENYREYTSEL